MIKAKNRYKHLDNGVTVIYFDNAPGKYTVIDTEDFDKVIGIKWSVNGAGYAQGKLYGREVSMHRVILGVENESGVIVDHINRNPLDNRKINLRIADYSVNRVNSRMDSRNKLGYRGIYWDRRNHKFGAKTNVNGIKIHLGLYDTPEEAYEAYLSYMVYQWGFENLPDYLQNDAIKFGIV